MFSKHTHNPPGSPDFFVWTSWRTAVVLEMKGFNPATASAQLKKGRDQLKAGKNHLKVHVDSESKVRGVLVIRKPSTRAALRLAYKVRGTAGEVVTSGTTWNPPPASA
jgi:hypothetical protein